MQNTRPEVINTHLTVSRQIYAKGCAARYQFFPTIILAKLSQFFFQIIVLEIPFC